MESRYISFLGRFSCVRFFFADGDFGADFLVVWKSSYSIVYVHRIPFFGPFRGMKRYHFDISVHDAVLENV
jgi:hypothetical protein